MSRIVGGVIAVLTFDKLNGDAESVVAHDSSTPVFPIVGS